MSTSTGCPPLLALLIFKLKYIIIFLRIMAFSLFCILESMILIMNAFAILNDRFLKKSILKLCNFICIVGLHMESMNLAAGGIPN
jgi:hypothetical protein